MCLKLCKRATKIVKMAQKGPNLDKVLLISPQIIVTETWFLVCRLQMSIGDTITILEQNVPKTLETCHQSVNRRRRRRRRRTTDGSWSHKLTPVSLRTIGHSRAKNLKSTYWKCIIAKSFKRNLSQNIYKYTKRLCWYDLQKCIVNVFFIFTNLL